MEQKHPTLVTVKCSRCKCDLVSREVEPESTTEIHAIPCPRCSVPLPGGKINVMKRVEALANGIIRTAKEIHPNPPVRGVPIAFASKIPSEQAEKEIREYSYDLFKRGEISQQEAARMNAMTVTELVQEDKRFASTPPLPEEFKKTARRVFLEDGEILERPED